MKKNRVGGEPSEKRAIPRRESFFSLTQRLNKQSREGNDKTELDGSSLDKKDYIAMILSAFLTVFLPAILVLGIMVIATMGIFGVFS